MDTAAYTLAPAPAPAKRRGRPPSGKTPEEKKAAERARVKLHYDANRERILARRREQYAAKA